MVVIRRDLLALYGPGFREGATALAILATSHLVNVSCGLVGWILLAGGRARTLLINNAVAAPFNIVLGLILIPRFGLVGTALAVLGSVVLINGMAILEVWLGYRVSRFVSLGIAGGLRSPSSSAVDDGTTNLTRLAWTVGHGSATSGSRCVCNDEANERA